MTEPIDNPEYWRLRLEAAPPDMKHHAIFRCPLGMWKRIEEVHRKILQEHIKFADSVLDFGCGWGRLLTLMPENWGGLYVGVDICPEFIREAVAKHPDRVWILGDLRSLHQVPWTTEKIDWAVGISIRPMVIRNMGQGVWDEMEHQIRKRVKRILYLEYDELDKGVVE